MLKKCIVVFIVVFTSLKVFGNEIPTVQIEDAKASIDLYNSLIIAISTVATVVIPVWIKSHYKAKYKVDDENE